MQRGERKVARLRSWWQQIKQRPYATGFLVLLVVVLILFIFFAYWFGWDWTGFNSNKNQITITSSSNGNYTATILQPSKSLWDWLGLLTALAIPVVVGFGVAWYTARQNHDREIAREQHENDLRIAADNQREAALQSYIDKMSDLLLEKLLLSPTSRSEVREIARVRTLTLLPQLDPIRKRSVLRFLYESGLIQGNNPIVDLSYANLRGAGLHHATLKDANLSNCDLREADLSGADLFEAKLIQVRLNGTNLTGAELRSANLNGADLTDADLNGAIVTQKQLTHTASLKGAIMPDGSKHP